MTAIRAPDLSVIIPCREGARPLARLLPQLGGRSDTEVIVACSGSHADVRAACELAGARCLELDAARGSRLRAAAAAASAPNLWFVHADSGLPNGAVAGVLEAFASGAVGGYFRFRLTGPRSFGKAVIEWGVKVRSRLGGIPYGDQAVFVTKSAYFAAGGHEDVALFDEFRLLRALKREPSFRSLELAVGVDPVRWERNGYFRHVLKNRSLSIAYLCGVSPERLARWYYD